MRILAVMAMVAALSAPVAAWAQSMADPVAGRKLALEVCAQCHFVAETQPVIPRSDAPPFAEVVADPAVTELSLRVFLRTPHQNMPNLQLSEKETDDVIAFILGLRNTGGDR